MRSGAGAFVAVGLEDDAASSAVAELLQGRCRQKAWATSDGERYMKLQDKGRGELGRAFKRGVVEGGVRLLVVVAARRGMWA